MSSSANSTGGGAGVALEVARTGSYTKRPSLRSMGSSSRNATAAAAAATPNASGFASSGPGAGGSTSANAASLMSSVIPGLPLPLPPSPGKSASDVLDLGSYPGLRTVNMDSQARTHAYTHATLRAAVVVERL